MLGDLAAAQVAGQMPGCDHRPESPELLPRSGGLGLSLLDSTGLLHDWQPVQTTAAGPTLSG
jgi:hypothetical protein